MTSSISDNSWIADYAQNFNPDEFEVVTWASKENPSFSKEEWEQLKAEIDPSIFRRRYEAKLEFATGRVYQNFNRDKHVLEVIPSSEKIIKAFLGIDWGYVDPTAVILILMSEQRIFYVSQEFLVEGAQLDIIVTVINKMRADIREKYDLSVSIYADPANKQLLETVKIKAKHDIQPGIRDIYAGTSAVRNLIFQNRFFVLKKCTGVLREMSQYRFLEKGWDRSEKPEDDNNHALDAIRYVIASYPLAGIKWKPSEDILDLPAFWLRRTRAYKNLQEAETKRVGNKNLWTI